MLRSLKDLERYKVSATDGDIGCVENFLLDDERWVVRYLIVETGVFLDGKRVLISPISFREAEWSTRQFHLALTIDKVKNSPNVDVNKSITREQERNYHNYYRYHHYWGSLGVWGMFDYPSVLAAVRQDQTPDENSPEASDDVHLRSANEVRGYQIQGSDDAIGHVEDFIVDDKTWEVRYLVINTSVWWFGKKVLVAPQWASRISWEERNVYLDLSRKAIKNSPKWNATMPINRELEEHLYDYYGRPVYWVTEGPPKEMQPPVHPESHLHFWE
jgi:hypothetical protein